VSTDSASGGRRLTEFFPNGNELLAYPGELQVHWTAKGTLCGILFRMGTWETVFGSVDASEGQIDRFSLASGSWLRGFELGLIPDERDNEMRIAVKALRILCIGQDDFECGPSLHKTVTKNWRLCLPKPGNAIVGLKGETHGGVITRFGILEYGSGSAAHTGYQINPTIQKHVWKDRIPTIETLGPTVTHANKFRSPDPGNLKFHEVRTGYWNASWHWDLIPMEMLVLGTSEEELRQVIGFSGHATCRGFAVHRSSGTIDKIGPWPEEESQIKYFPIDGAGGERITGVELQVGALPTGLRIVTNRHRQIVFGVDRDNVALQHSAHPDCVFAGFCASWGYNCKGKETVPRMTSMTAFSAITHLGFGELPPTPDFDTTRDAVGRTWVPHPPPSSWTSNVDSFYGKEAEGGVTSYIDFSRPIAKIEGLLPAPQWMDMIELGGLTIVYADGERLVLGVTTKHWPKDATEGQSLKDMPRREDIATSLPPRGTDGGEIAHVQSNEEALAQATMWDLGESGEEVVAVSVWAKQFLHGIQFHSRSGHSSPRWGKCGGDPAGKIELGGIDHVMGVKVVLGKSRQGLHAASVRPLAVQALCEQA